MTPPDISVTISSYEQGLDAYLLDSDRPPIPIYAAFRRRILDLVQPGARMLELGSGPGHDAHFFESHGLPVRRTDGAQGFVDHLRAGGHQAEVLDMTRDALGGPYQIIFANVVLLHLTADEFEEVLARAVHSVGPGGILAFTVKEGDGEEWSTAKLGRPRFFRYWREEDLRTRLNGAGWRLISLEHVHGRIEPWMYVICVRGRITSMDTNTPPGSWLSPITSDQAVTSGRGLEAVAFAGDQVWWSEGRPSEGGRVCVCTSGPNGSVTDLLPPPWNARTRVHEYGGTSWVPVPRAAGFDLVFANLADQRLYRSTGEGEPMPLTPAPEQPCGLRYADFQLDERRSRLLAVRETHRGDGTFGTVDRTVVAIPLDGTGVADESAILDLLIGQPKSDFLAAPRLSPSGDSMVWISWNHPDMPWDSTTVHLARLGRSGNVEQVRQVAGGEGISVVDPAFLPDGSILVISDESGWWQPILIDPRSGSKRTLIDSETEFAAPLWVLGRRQWAAVPGGRLLLRPDGRPSVLDTFSGALTELDAAWTGVADLATDRSGRIALIVQGDALPGQVVVIGPSGERSVLRSAVDKPLPVGFAPVPEPRTFDGVHAVIYPPTNPGFEAERGTAPVILTIHGGPTGQHSRTLSVTTAYFTSRGFAVAAVDYRGSTGYGRPYRDALKGRWAALDIADAITVANGLLKDGTAGSALISGGSAGGLTVLGALTTDSNPFSAGVSSYGIGDLSALAATTHDFESRYMDQLLGTDPQILIDRSPLHHADALATPVLLLQGGKDPIVTPDQAESFAAVCAAKGVPHALIVFPEEGHGFRAADARKTALEAELAFYGQVLGFATPGVPSVKLVSGNMP